MPIQWFGDKITKLVDDAFERKARAAGQKMVAVAKSLVPVDTAATKNSIMYLYEPKTRTLSLVVGTPYSLFLEYGTYKMAPRPYLRPALLAAAPMFGIKTGIVAPMSLPHGYTPRTIMPHIRPHIAMANKTYNRGAVKRSKTTAFNTDRANRALRDQQGRPHKTDLSHLHHLKKAWN